MPNRTLLGILTLVALAAGCRRPIACAPYVYSETLLTCVCPPGTESAPSGACVGDGGVIVIAGDGGVPQDGAVGGADGSPADGGTGTADAGLVDPGSADAASAIDGFVPLDAGPTDRVRVRVVRASNPAADITVVFHDAAGAVLGESRTDALGDALLNSSDVRAITVLDPGDAAGGVAVRLYTMLDVRPDDVVTIDLPGDGGLVSSANFTLPGAFTGAIGYLAYGPCGDVQYAESAAELQSPVCSDESLSIFALGSESEFSALAFIAAFGLGAGSTVHPLENWRTDWRNVNVSLGGFAANAIATVRVTANDLRIGSGRSATGGMIRVIPSLPTNAWIRLNAAVSIAEQPYPSSAWFYQRFFGSLPATGLAFDNALVPRLASLAASNAVAARPRIDFALSNAAQADYVRTVLDYRGLARDVVWTLYASPSATSISVPALPSRLDDLSPASAVPSFTFQASAVDTLTGWNAFRLRPRSPADAANSSAWVESSGSF